MAGGKEIAEAWEIYGKRNNDLSNPNHGWHRDYIYYGIDKNHPVGPFSYKYKEYITSFKMQGTPHSALGQLSQTSSSSSNFSDPGLCSIPIITKTKPENFNVGMFWTDGDFEFNVYGTNNYMQTTKSYKRGFTATPHDLFDIQYNYASTSVWWYPGSWGDYMYGITSIATKTMSLGTKVEFEAWNLETLGTEYKFRIEEVDINEEITRQESSTSKWVTNFEANASFGTTVKVGAKAGVTHEQTQGVTETVKYTRGSNDLAEVNIHFGENVIIDENTTTKLGRTITTYKFKSYSSGLFEITFRPLQTQ